VEETTVSRSPETLNLLNPSPPTNRKTTVKSSRERKRERERERERVEFTRIWRRRRRRREQERMGYARIRWHLVARVAGGLPHVACAL
jgi:hypothetical protein